MSSLKKEKITLTKKDIDDCLTSVYNVGNEILYDMCKKYPSHIDDQQIIAKSWLIGRSYGVALERYKPKGKKLNNDSFYKEKVPQAFKKLDGHLNELKDLKEITGESIVRCLEVHNCLIEELKKITDGQIKRSFCSKYLHFHLWEMFFIYDQIAATSLGKLNYQLKTPKDLKVKITTIKADARYAEFCCKCLALKRKIEADFGRVLTNRQLDNLLLNIAK